MAFFLFGLGNCIMVILNDSVSKLVIIYSKENTQVTDIRMYSPNSNQLF